MTRYCGRSVKANDVCIRVAPLQSGHQADNQAALDKAVTSAGGTSTQQADNANNRGVSGQGGVRVQGTIISPNGVENHR